MSNQSWPEMLDNVDQMLAHSAAAAEEREQAAAAAPTVAPDRAASWRQFLEQLEQHLSGLQRCTEQATSAATAVDAELAAAQDAVRAWQQAREALVRKLANEAEPSV